MKPQYTNNPGNNKPARIAPPQAPSFDLIILSPINAPARLEKIPRGIVMPNRKPTDVAIPHKIPITNPTMILPVAEYLTFG